VYYKGSIDTWLKISFSLFFSNPLSCGATLYIDNTPIIDLVIPNTITSIERSTLKHTNFKSIIIPNSVTSIGNLAFDGCEQLAKITYLGTEENWKNIKIDGISEQFKFPPIKIKFQDTKKTEKQKMKKLIYCRAKFINNLAGKSYYCKPFGLTMTSASPRPPKYAYTSFLSIAA